MKIVSNYFIDDDRVSIALWGDIRQLGRQLQIVIFGYHIRGCALPKIEPSVREHWSDSANEL